MPVPSTVYLHRITHIDNLDYIISNGKITCPDHNETDAGYINIGDTSLIENRGRTEIQLEPGGFFTDYVAFYFGRRSPMLYNIQHGYKGVTKRNPGDIIYLVSSLEEVKKTGRPYIFTDGHAFDAMTQFFNQEQYLKEIDWVMVNAGYWNITEEDPDRKRRKQAELLVHRELPLSAVLAIVVYDSLTKTKVITNLEEHELKDKVFVYPNWYY